MTGYDITGEVPRDVLEQAMTIVGLAVRPAANEFIVGELTRLRLVTAGAERTDEDLHATFCFYAEELSTARSRPHCLKRAWVCEARDKCLATAPASPPTISQSISAALAATQFGYHLRCICRSRSINTNRDDG